MTSPNAQALLKISACIIFTKVPLAKQVSRPSLDSREGGGEVDSISWWEGSKGFVAIFATDHKSEEIKEV